MFDFKRSQLVILIISTNLLLDTFATVISKTSLPHVSPSRKLNQLPNNNAYVMSRSNSGNNLQNNQNLPNVRTSRTNLTSENSRLNEEIQSPQLESVSSNFTTDDVQTTLINDKTLELNVSNSEVKPSEDNIITNKNILNSASQNDNFQIAQVDTFNNKDNLEYSSSLFNQENFNYISCLTCANYGSDRKDSFFTSCCQLGYNDCCPNNNQNIAPATNTAFSSNNLPTTNNNVPVNNNAPINNNNLLNSNLLNSNTISNNIIPTNANVAISNDKNVQSNPTATAAVSNPLSTNNKNNSPTQPENYGTKSKIKSPANKIKNVESTDENIDVRQQQQHQPINNNYPIPGFIPSQISGVYNSKDDKIYYTNNINPNQLFQLYNNLQRNNMQYSPNVLNNLYSNSANSNINNNNQYTNQFQGFVRKTSLPNKPGTKSNSNSIIDSSFNQAITDQQTLSKQPNENQQSVTNPIQINNPVVVDSINPSANSINQIQQANAQNGMQRQNNRNPTEINSQQQQHPTQQQSGIFSSFISHIPFIGYRPVVFGYGSPSQQQQQQNPTQQQINNAQIAQLVASTSDNQYSNQYNPYGAVIAINPHTQNAQLLNQNQINTNQLPTKIADQQNANNQASQSPGIVSTIFSRPLNLYNRIGGYLTKPNILTNSDNIKVLHYANQVIPLNAIPEILNEPQMQNILQQYSRPLNLNYDANGQYNGPMYIQFMKDTSAKSSKRS